MPTRLGCGIAALLLIAAAGCGRSAANHRTAVAIPAPTAAPAAVVVDTTDPIGQRIDRYLTSLEALGFSGAIIVDHQGRVVLRRGYGLADREARRPYTPATVQSMGSITKQITAAAVLLLEERGMLRVADPISRYLSGVPADKQAITLHHLLTHQSGLPGAIGWDAEAIDGPMFLSRALEASLEFAPGEGAGYSNVGYSLLGIIIERVTGRGYEELIRQELLLPAGLADSGYRLPQREDSLLAAGYRDGELHSRADDSSWLPDGPGWNLRANGGLRTTVDDMHRWLRVLQGAGPLSPELVARWTDRHVVVNDELSLGYGWNTYTTPAGRLIAHLGGNPAFASAFGWLPERELFYYVQGNTSLWPAEQMEATLLALVFDADQPLPPLLEADPGASPRIAAGRAGEFFADGASVRLRPDDVRLRAELSGQSMLDAALGHDAAERARFGRLNDAASRAVARLHAGREDALEGLVAAPADPADRARSLLRLLQRTGDVKAMAIVGSVANVPGSRFAEHGGSTTFVRVDLEEGARILSMHWRDDGTYRGAAMGPLSDVPSFVLVPVAGGGYTGVEREAPWRTQAFAFAGERERLRPPAIASSSATCRRAGNSSSTSAPSAARATRASKESTARSLTDGE